MAKVRIMTTLSAGDMAPDFNAEDQDGNQVKLSDFKGKKLVLFFYPKASTPVVPHKPVTSGITGILSRKKAMQ